MSPSEARKAKMLRSFAAAQALDCDRNEIMKCVDRLERGGGFTAA